MKGDSNGGKTNKDGNWKKRLKKALKSDTAGLKSVMSLLAEEKKNKSAFVAAL